MGERHDLISVDEAGHLSGAVAVRAENVPYRSDLSRAASLRTVEHDPVLRPSRALRLSRLVASGQVAITSKADIFRAAIAEACTDVHSEFTHPSWPVNSLTDLPVDGSGDRWLSRVASIWPDGRIALDRALDCVLHAGAVDATALVADPGVTVLGVAKMLDPVGWRRVMAAVRNALAGDGNRVFSVVGRGEGKGTSGSRIYSPADIEAAADAAGQAFETICARVVVAWLEQNDLIDYAGGRKSIS